MNIEEVLRSAQPRLIIRGDCLTENEIKLRPHIREAAPDHEVIDEGYDPDNWPLGCPVYWRVVQRSDGKFYLSTFLLPRACVVQGWGEEGLAHCDPVTGMAAVRIETFVSPKER